MSSIVEEELRMGCEAFRWSLHRKTERFGEISVDHFWLDTRLVYGQRARAAQVPSEIMRFYQRLCVAHSTFDEPATRESYLLAMLVSRVRTTAAQRVVADARLRSQAGFRRRRLPEYARDLERYLVASPAERFSSVVFQSRTADILGIPTYNDEQRRVCGLILADLLDDACELVDTDLDAAVAVVRRRWSALQRRIGRRAGHELEKQALDAISYESKAAFHRCYSALWCCLLPQLQSNYRLTEQSLLFHRFWHTDNTVLADDTEYFRPFHGHVLGLHPAGAALMQTPTGRARMGAWLQDPTSEDRFGALLHAIYLAVCQYTGERVTQNADRRGSIPPLPSESEQDSDRGARRRPRRPR